MTIPFEPTRSYAYKAARYELLPILVEIAEPFGDQPFLLRELWKPLLRETYTQEQLDALVPKAQKPDVKERMSAVIGHYIPFLAEELKIFERLGGGMFRNISLEEELQRLMLSPLMLIQTMTVSFTPTSSPRSEKMMTNRLPLRLSCRRQEKLKPEL